MKKKLVRSTTEHFRQIFHEKPEYVFLSPGRINIIGEHVDYNDGYVLPAAINKYICFAISRNNSSSCVLHACDMQDTYQFSLDEPVKPVDKSWVNYILGVVSQLQEKGFNLRGVNVVFSSTIPMGAGLSSSAALECGYCYAMNSIFHLGLSKESIAKIGQKSEHNFVGVNCGIMDQFASVFGKKNKAIRLDCNTLEHDYHKIDFTGYSLLLLDSKVKHTHLTSGYNIRRQEVDKGIGIIRTHYPHVRTFRDCTKEMVEKLREALGETIYKRCHFVVREIQRVQDAVQAIERKDFLALGKLMSETHEGLSKEYEVSCPELDFLVDAANHEKTVIGSRMMGGGFGGCSINLVEKGSEKKLIKLIGEQYKKAFGIKLEAYKIKISDGTRQYREIH